MKRYEFDGFVTKLGCLILFLLVIVMNLSCMLLGMYLKSGAK